MKKYLLIFLPPVALLALVLSCSGSVSNMFGGRIVPPSHLLQFRGGGSLSTLWYLGSDKDYHYFAHFVKVSTQYRVRREELQVPDEFQYKSQKGVYVGNASFWGAIEKPKETSQPPAET